MNRAKLKLYQDFLTKPAWREVAAKGLLLHGTVCDAWVTQLFAVLLAPLFDEAAARQLVAQVRSASVWFRHEILVDHGPDALPHPSLADGADYEASMVEQLRGLHAVIALSDMEGALLIDVTPPTKAGLN